MKYFFKYIYSFLLLIAILLPSSKTFSMNTELKYSQENISNYFLGIVSLDQDNTTTGFKYLNKVKYLINIHSNYNIQFVRSLILLNKFDKAFSFSKKVWSEDENFFEADLLLGIEYFLKKDYLKAEKHFERLNEFTRYNIFFDDFFGNTLIAWVKASQNDKKNSFRIFNKIPDRYSHLKRIQNVFLQCHFNTPETENEYKKLISSKDFNFSRYKVFFSNYFLHKNNNKEALSLVRSNKDKLNSNLLIKQSEFFILNGESKKVKNFFNCSNPKNAMAEFFYVIANLYNSQENYQLSNFYLKISLFLNEKFTPNMTLLAENFYYQSKYNNAKDTYKLMKSIGPIYSWYASKNIATILLDAKDKKYATSSLEKAFNSLKNPNYEKYYDLANFYKDNGYFKKSIKYYSLTLKKIKNNHFLVPKILDRRGSSYERVGDWDKAEKDLKKSLQLVPDEPYVLNYLAYSWIEKKINIDQALKMLKRAAELKKDDGYIADSLGWAHYINKNYTEAEKFLKKAVELIPFDPIISDHYADALWMLDKKIQARYFWKSILNIDTAKEKLKKNVTKKLIFGITKNI